MNTAIKLAIGVGAIIVLGTGAVGVDFFLKYRAAEDTFGPKEYVMSYLDPLSEQGGTIGLMLRKSTAIKAGFPEAPEGYARDAWSGVHDARLYSDAQAAVLDAELARALGETDIRAIDKDMAALLAAYVEDTSYMYSKGDAVIGMILADLSRPINHPVLRDHHAAIDVHFAKQARDARFGTYQRIDWREVTGPVERASGGSLPHRLRSFEGRLDGVTVTLVTRARTADIRDFLRTTDFNGVRALAGLEPIDPPTPGEAQESLKVASLPADDGEEGGFLANGLFGLGKSEPEPVYDARNPPPPNKDANIKINRPAKEQSGCSQGNFCKVEETSSAE
jgi:hypothetical protein